MAEKRAPDAAQIMKAEELAELLARAPKDDQALAIAMGQAVLVGKALADQCRESEKTA